MIAYGDELGFLYIFSLEEMAQVQQIRSMGYSILDINIDLSYSITVAYHTTLSVFDKSGTNLKTFNLTESKGKILRMKRKQNIVVVSTDQAHFILVDLIGEEILSEVDCVNAALIGGETLLEMDFNKDFQKAVSGNSSGEIIAFDMI